MIDGLPELLIGSIFLFTGSVQLVLSAVPANIAAWANLLLPLALIPLILSGRTILHALKIRITYPRTGYVAYRQPPRWQRALGGLVGIGVGIALANLTFNVQLAEAWMPVLMGATLAAGLSYLGAYLGMRRFYALAAFVATLGIFMHRTPMNGFLGATLVIATAGAWMLISGSVTLYRYLKHTSIEES